MPTEPLPKIYSLVVAAGVGKRFGGDLPKQYTQIHDKTVLQHSISALSQVRHLSECYLVIADTDDIAKNLSFDMPIRWVTGGAERINSVFNGVQAIVQTLECLDNHWVLIHDAARPCVKPADIENLIDKVIKDAVGQQSGGILAVPVRDTVKKVAQIDQQPVAETTLDRNHLWLAQTPQLFPLARLYRYLTQAIEQGIAFTDEASLFENFNHTPMLIEGSHCNIKLTFAEDLTIARALLS